MKRRLAGRILCAALLIAAVSLSACGKKDQEGAGAPAAEAEQAEAGAEDGTEQNPFAHYPKNAYSDFYDPDEYVEVADYSSLTAYADLTVQPTAEPTAPRWWAQVSPPRRSAAKCSTCKPKVATAL